MDATLGDAEAQRTREVEELFRRRTLSLAQLETADPVRCYMKRVSQFFLSRDRLLETLQKHDEQLRGFQTDASVREFDELLHIVNALGSTLG